MANLPSSRRSTTITRNETARLRRERRTRTTKPSMLRGGHKRQKRVTSVPPVLVRGDMVGVAVKPRKLGASKRRYDVALNVPGAEVRLPALPTIHLSWRMASGMMSLLLLALVIHLWTSPKYRISTVTVEGLKRISVNDINIVLGLSNQPIFSVSPVQVKSTLQQAFPDLEAVSVKVKLPAKVAITVKERIPVISWVYNGQEQWVDAGGYVFPPRGSVDALIRVEAQNPPPTIEKALPTQTDTQLLTPEFVKTVQQMAAQTPQGSPLVYDAKRGLGWVDGRGWQVYFGMDLSEIEMKLVVYQAMVQRLEQEGIRPVIISVEYVHAPYYRLEQ